MADQQHRATAGEWASVKACANDVVTYSTILELLHRIEALEAAQQAKPNHPEKPDSPLVDRVAFAITGDSDELINWKPEARAAIRAVAAWMTSNPDHHFPPALVFALDKEAEHR